ncbi:MAG: helix-turn-helix domain-containing protein [Alphaproteobacteria bacterium]
MTDRNTAPLTQTFFPLFTHAGPDFIQDNEQIDTEDFHKRGLSQVVEMHLKSYFRSLGNHTPASGHLYKNIIKEIERPLIEQTLKFAGGNQKQAADLLGLNRNTLKKKITELDISVEAFK